MLIAAGALQAILSVPALAAGLRARGAPRRRHETHHPAYARQLIVVSSTATARTGLSRDVRTYSRSGPERAAGRAMAGETAPGTCRRKAEGDRDYRCDRSDLIAAAGWAPYRTTGFAALVGERSWNGDVPPTRISRSSSLQHSTRSSSRRAAAPGSGIFLHSWMDGPTEGCVALQTRNCSTSCAGCGRPLHPVIEIGTDRAG